MSEELKNLIETNLPDNTSRDIKARHVREVTEAIVDEIDGLTYSFGDLSGSVGNAQFSGTYSVGSIKTNGLNTVFSVPSSGSPNPYGRTVVNLAELRSSSSNTIGAVVFTSPIAISSLMFSLEIEVSTYTAGGISSGRIAVSGYWTGSAWQGSTKTSLNTSNIVVRLGRTADGKLTVILGEDFTTWSYPHVTIVSAKFSSTDASDALCKNWTVSVMTNLSSIQNLTSSIVESLSYSVSQGLSGKANSSHTHAISDITDLVSTLEGKAASSHSHTINNITGLNDALNNRVVTFLSVGSGTDLNTVIDSGFYKLPASFINGPDAQNGRLLVIGGSTTVGQMIISSTNRRMWFRGGTLSPTVFTEWTSISPHIVSTERPASEDGENGDIWLKIE